MFVVGDFFVGVVVLNRDHKCSHYATNLAAAGRVANGAAPDRWAAGILEALGAHARRVGTTCA